MPSSSSSLFQYVMGVISVKEIVIGNTNHLLLRSRQAAPPLFCPLFLFPPFLSVSHIAIQVIINNRTPNLHCHAVLFKFPVWVHLFKCHIGNPLFLSFNRKLQPHISQPSRNLPANVLKTSEDTTLHQSPAKSPAVVNGQNIFKHVWESLIYFLTWCLFIILVWSKF